ncbi:hypothetical protein Tco_0485618 [Tanacetum coccineum]
MISVPPKFEAKISATEESCDLDTLTVSELTSKLQAQEQRVSIRSEEKVEGAFRISSRSNKAGNSKQNTFRRGNFTKGNNKGSTSQNSSSTSKKVQPIATTLDILRSIVEQRKLITTHKEFSKQMFPRRISLDTKDNPRVKLGDGRYTRAKGRGTIAINTKKGTKYISRAMNAGVVDSNMYHRLIAMQKDGGCG